MKEGRAVPVAETGGEALEVVGCGRVLPGHALRIIDEVGREVGERAPQAGEAVGPVGEGLDDHLPRPERIREWQYEFDPSGLELLRRSIEHVLASRREPSSDPAPVGA